MLCTMTVASERRTLKALFVMQAAAIAVCLGLLSAGSAFGQEYHYGVNTELDLVPFRAAVTDKTAELGADILRMSFGWDVIEPGCKGCFDWSTTDAWRDEARRTGRHIFASIGYTPRWANGGRSFNYPPDNDQDWYDFVFAIVTRYRDDIVLWGIWNEPDLDAFLHGRDLRAYQTLVTTGAAAIRAANPHALVLGPEVSPLGAKNGWYPAAMQLMGDEFDIVTVHWYPDGPVLAYMMDDLVRPYSRRKSVWLTEVGARPCESMYGEVGQAVFYQKVLDAFLARRNWWTAVVFYDLYEKPRPLECGLAIVRPDWSNRPAFSLFQAYIKAHP
jgi:hypothetical protein